MVRNRYAIALLLSALVGAAGCGGADGPEQTAAGDTTNGMPGHDMSGMGGMAMDPVMMRRHAVELDSLVIRMREHLEQMRQLSPREWHARMTEHAPMVAGMVAVIDRQAREMEMGMNTSDESMGEMTGMSAEEYRALRSEVEALRTGIGELQTAGEADAAARMPAHLARIERLLATMEATAAHMREM